MRHCEQDALTDAINGVAMDVTDESPFGDKNHVIRIQKSDEPCTKKMSKNSIEKNGFHLVRQTRFF